ncbi:hypothetical protein ACFUIY_21250 [Streptomyces griseorubiginosus]|uniref:hypothetical protein n=1 Tax=Streptomyces griseorubiginosus TaxID=67304 RepID=UPI003639DAD2
MRLNLTEFRPRTGPREHRVVRPRHTLRHTSLTAPEPIGLLLGDHDGLRQLAGLFSFAASSRHTIVHVPLRDGIPPDEGWGERVDLVLAHHAYGLRPSKWPGLRRALGSGVPLSVGTDDARTRDDAEAWRRRQTHADFRDELRHATHARTLFLFGSRDAFARTAVELAWAADWGPRQKGADTGASVLATAVSPKQPPGGGHPYELLVCFRKPVR